MLPYQVKISKTKSRHVINIPVSLAREIGLNKADYVLISQSANNKLEIKRYDDDKDYGEYIQRNRGVLDRPSE